MGAVHHQPPDHAAQTLAPALRAETAIRLHDITVAYRGHPAVHHLSGHFSTGSLTAVVGPNGAGKSSLLAAIMGQLPLAQGRVEWQAGLQGHIAWLPQRADIDRSFPISVPDLVGLGHWRQLGSLRGLRAPHKAAVQQAMAAVGLVGFEQRLIGEISTGQFQRALFARVLVQDAPVILLDEPFAGIDARTTADLLALVQQWHVQQRTVIAVLHDIEQVRAHFHQTLLLARRCVAWGDTSWVTDSAHLTLARQMAEAWDESAPACEVGHGGGGAAHSSGLGPALHDGHAAHGFGGDHAHHDHLHGPSTTPQRPDAPPVHRAAA
jgi:zinc/manganese transport system ATP-binding protein